MYNRQLIDDLVKLICQHDGIADKNCLAGITQQKFSLIMDRSVYYCVDFAIRFSSSNTSNMSNTVLSLSALQKFDDRPFIVCIVTPTKNHLLLANATFLSKISHSSQQLRNDNIRGSFNGSDIMRCLGGIDNSPENFSELFDIHVGLAFDDNLSRLVEKTNNIVPTGRRFHPSTDEERIIYDAPVRAKKFTASVDYIDLKTDLVNRTSAFSSEIAIAAFIENVNIRGRIIEYLISSDELTLKQQLVDSLHNKKPFPSFKTSDNLGDYSKTYIDFDTQTDIKTKVLFFDGNPKAYNVDKLLSFLSKDRSVYMVFLVGIGKTGGIQMELCSIFQKQLLDSTVVLNHWAGRNSRGVTQFKGKALVDILTSMNSVINVDEAKVFIKTMLDL